MITLEYLFGTWYHVRYLRRGVRAGYRRADEPTAAELVEDSDDQLFHRGRGLYLHAKFHYLDPSNRLATVHQRYRQTMVIRSYNHETDRHDRTDRTDNGSMA